MAMLYKVGYMRRDSYSGDYVENAFNYNQRILK